MKIIFFFNSNEHSQQISVEIREGIRDSVD